MEDCKVGESVGGSNVEEVGINGVKVRFVDFGFAFRVEDTIYLNRMLKDYPILLDEVLMHELAHSNGFNLHDLLVDCRPGLPSWSKWKFYFSHASAWWNFVPAFRVDGKWRYDITLFLLYLIILLCLVGLSIYSIRIYLILQGWII